jgi:CheY-like chemotaxis protein
VTLEGVGADARLSVRDRGIGIAAEDQARIFERFERLVPQRHTGGFGLGLWITRQIVDALGGTIRVRSTPGRGSTFIVELPRGIQREETENAPRARNDVRGTILLVEDDEDILQVVADALSAEGHRVVPTSNGREALEYLNRAPRPCLILLDLAMPIMDGWRFLEELKARPALAEVPVVLLSANGRLAQAAEALRVAAYLQKPLQREHLLSVIEKHLPEPRPVARGDA